MTKRRYKIPSSHTLTTATGTKHFALKFTIFVALVVFIYGIMWHLPRYIQIHYQMRIFPSKQERENSTRLKSDFNCFDKSNDFKLEQKGEYWAAYNCLRANRWFACHESITLATMSDPTFLDNLIPLVEYWNGPISVAVYTPGTDMEIALRIIRYLRKCSTSLISEYVTFHFYFNAKHVPPNFSRIKEESTEEAEFCSSPPPWRNINASDMYRFQKNLIFPINLGRNVARDGATTHFILTSDIELFPSRNLISNFLNMVQQNKLHLRASPPCVFVLAPFEVKETVNIPSTKAELSLMLANKTAIDFHKQLCGDCHRIPEYQRWLNANITEGLHVTHTVKKSGKWEPFYIGTNREPYFDERFYWEGKIDKMPQVYAMCLLNYDFHILDNAFLIHKPGIKVYKTNRYLLAHTWKTIQRIEKEIEPELHTLYGINENCSKIRWYY